MTTSTVYYDLRYEGRGLSSISHPIEFEDSVDSAIQYNGAKTDMIWRSLR